MSEYPTWNPEDPEESFNNLIRILELKDDDKREGNFRGIAGTQLKEKTVKAENIGDSEVVTTNLADESVLHVKLGVSSVWGDRLGATAVSTGHIQASAVNADQLNSTAVTTPKINNGAVTGPKIAVSAVSAGNLDSNAVTTTKINNGAVTGDKIATSTISESNLNFPVKQRYLVGPWTYLNPPASSTGLVTFYLVTDGSFVGAFNNGYPYAVGRACRLTGVFTRVSDPRTAGSMTVNVLSTLQGSLSLSNLINATNPAYHATTNLSGPTLSVGEGLGVALTTNASWAPSSPQHVLIWLEFTET